MLDLDHPADIQVHSWSDCLEGTFTSAAMAMLTFMSGTDDLCNSAVMTEQSLHLHSIDLEALLHDFLNELLYLFVVGKVACSFKSVKIQEENAARWTIDCTANVVDYDQAVHGQGSEVKAVTFSNLKVNRQFPFDAYIVLDI